MRSLIALALALHYLLTGVLGSAWVTLARDPAPSAQHPYVHSVLCQTHNYLRLDCFDECNGRQPGHLLKQLASGDNHPDGAPQTLAKTICDVHVLAEPVRVPLAPRAFRRALLVSTHPVPALLTADKSVEGPPPQVVFASLG